MIAAAGARRACLAARRRVREFRSDARGAIYAAGCRHTAAV